MVGKRVRELRLQKGIQQSFVARKLGYKSSSSLNDIEMGRRKLKADQIPLLAEILDVEVSDLFLKGKVRETRNDINSA
ncbi:helix-turn-helix domain-containing protein [Psychrobacillus sp. MER TA 17]|nr:helix-turn-helix domain-containing protein [Psychrobacillus sp. MER TA 17]